MKKLIVISIVILMAYSCKKPYAPIAITSNNSYLVIEGLINTGADSTYIKLTRTTRLSGPDTISAELNAAVTVEGNDNTTYPLQDAGNGIYSAPPLGLSTAVQYRLRVVAADHTTYLSDFVEAKTTPPIDSVTYVTENDGVEFYVTTHDPSNSTRYYRWDFNETWGYIADQESYFKIGDDGLPAYRVDQQDKIYECFKTAPSYQVLLGTSSRLSQDVINKLPVNFITAGSGKVSHGYSVLFRQYALTSDGYSYWQQLKKNTEDIGTIFDVQPSAIPSNIHCISNPQQPVIGFVSASTVTSQRIFVDEQNTIAVVPTYLPPPSIDDCASDVGEIYTAPPESFASRLHRLTFTGDTVLLGAITDLATGQIEGYSYTAKQCTDCRIKAPFGTNSIPVFWPANYHF